MSARPFVPSAVPIILANPIAAINFAYAWGGS